MTAKTLDEARSPELFPYTADDHAFIEEITAEHPPIAYTPLPSLISRHLRWHLQAADELQVLSETYSFPWSSPFGVATQVELSNQLDEVLLKIQTQPWGYIRHRNLYCMLVLSMNTLGLQAPAFRHNPTIPWQASEQTTEHMLIQRDRIVIDCHWLYCTKSKMYANEGQWRGLVNPKLRLQTDRIEKFAATKVRNDYRANDLMKLTQFQQAQMAAIRNTQMQSNFRTLGAMVTGAGGVRTMGHFKRIDRAILEWSCSQSRFEKHYGKYRAYAMAYQLLDNPTRKQVAQLAGFIIGERPLNDSSARRTIAHLAQLTAKI
jgi:hypothetical protein